MKRWVHAPPVDILGVPVSPWEKDGLIDSILGSAAGTRDRETPWLSTVHYANVHVLNTAYRNRELRQQLARASTVYCDGSGIRLGAALLGRQLPPRLTAADWIDDLCTRAARDDTSLYFLGGAEGVGARAAAILTTRHPALRIVGIHHGFLDEDLSARVIRHVNDAGAGILLVGMGTPDQEMWVATHRCGIEAPVVWTVGALFDFIAGVQRRAPPWLASRHMEWLWRLGTDPRRLAGRYVVGNTLFCLRVIRQRLAGLPRSISP